MCKIEAESARSKAVSVFRPPQSGKGVQICTIEAESARSKAIGTAVDSCVERSKAKPI